MNLHSAQEYFANALTVREAQPAELFESTVCSNSRIPGQLAIEIYRNNTQGVRVKALQVVYPVLGQIVGEQCFSQLAHDYVRSRPSGYSDLNLYGGMFPDFIRQLMQNRNAFVELPYLCDLARLEWLVNAAYYADNDVSNLDGLRNEESKIVLKTSHALGLVQSEYPVYAIWQAHKTNLKLTEIEALKETDYLVIYRNKFIPSITQVDIEDWKLLTEIMKMTTLNMLAEYSMSMKLSLSKRLPDLMQRGWVTVA